MHALVAKLPEHYGPLFPSIDGSLYTGSYPWPRQIEEGVWVLRWPKALKLDDVPVIKTPAVVRVKDEDQDEEAVPKRLRKRRKKK